MMYELIQLGQRSYYINSPVKVGVYRNNETEVCLIDSGNDKEAGKKILKILESNNWKLGCIINTHSNADHIGGNNYLQQHTGCTIFSSGIEVAFSKFPILEPSFLYGGYPCKDLQHKFLLAAESNVIDLTSENFPKDLHVIPLPGHFFHMVGIRTPDDVVFLADSVNSEMILEKYQISFIYDVSKYLETLSMIKTIQAEIFVPAHAEVTRDIRPLAELNYKKIIEISGKILEICRQPLCFEDILQKIFAAYQLTMTFEQYVLVGSTVRSYLSWLKDEGKLNIQFKENRLLWQAKSGS